MFVERGGPAFVGAGQGFAVLVDFVVEFIGECWLERRHVVAVIEALGCDVMEHPALNSVV